MRNVRKFERVENEKKKKNSYNITDIFSHDYLLSVIFKNRF